VRVLLTGAGGFSGQHLVRHLVESDVEVHAMGRRATVPNHHYADPFDVESVRLAISRARPTYLVHLAGVASSSDISTYYAANTVYASVLFQALDLARVDCPVLLVGTSAEYGEVTSAQLPITEETEPRPYSHYGISKLCQTQLGLVVARGGRPVVVARPFNLIGPGMPPYNAVQSFARQVVDIMKGRREPVVEVGNLKASRDLVAVEDAVRTYWGLVRSPKAYGQIVNVCTGSDTTMEDVLAVLLSEARIPIDVKVAPERVKAIDIDRHYGSVTRLVSILGDHPKARVVPMLKRIVEALVLES
jgi:nucleoside-diphosphate-sugar epimerase